MIEKEEENVYKIQNAVTFNNPVIDRGSPFPGDSGKSVGYHRG